MRNPLIITIGREYGSGGREIGELVAKTLGIAYYDKSSSPWPRRRAACPTSSSPTTSSACAAASCRTSPQAPRIPAASSQPVSAAGRIHLHLRGAGHPRHRREGERGHRRPLRRYILAGRDNTINAFVYAPRRCASTASWRCHNLSEAEALKAISIRQGARQPLFPLHGSEVGQGAELRRLHQLRADGH